MGCGIPGFLLLPAILDSTISLMGLQKAVEISVGMGEVPSRARADEVGRLTATGDTVGMLGFGMIPRGSQRGTPARFMRSVTGPPRWA